MPLAIAETHAASARRRNAAIDSRGNLSSRSNKFSRFGRRSPSRHAWAVRTLIPMRCANAASPNSAINAGNVSASSIRH